MLRCIVDPPQIIQRTLDEGPTMAAQYRTEAKGFDGYIIRKWQEPKVVIQNAIAKICN